MGFNFDWKKVCETITDLDKGIEAMVEEAEEESGDEIQSKSDKKAMKMKLLSKFTVISNCNCRATSDVTTLAIRKTKLAEFLMGNQIRELTRCALARSLCFRSIFF